MVRSLIITYNNNKKEGMQSLIKIGRLSGAAARTGDLKEKIERTSYENNRITTGTNPTVIVQARTIVKLY